MRNAFVSELVALAEVHPHVALVVGDLGYSVIEPFADRFPDRFINAGVAEQNMMGLAAGMASEGYHVFTYSIANFPTFRCAEQIRNDVAYHKLPVTVVAVGGGVAYGALGYSHHAVQDYALLRVMPDMLIAAPGDPMEVRACMRYLVANPGPSYLRLCKAGEESFHMAPPAVAPGEWLTIREGGREGAIVSTGAALGAAMAWARQPEFENASVFSVPLWSMADKQSQVKHLRERRTVMAVEDHLPDGGFGSWLLEAKATDPSVQCSISLRALSADVCGTVGSQQVLNALGGLMP